MPFFSLFALLWATASATAAAAVSSSSSDLYLYNDVQANRPVMEVKRDDFFPRVPISKPRIVVFYSPTCPSCQAYRPKFVELAQDIKRELWKTKLTSYSVSCEAHPKLCREAGVESYPTVQLTLDKGTTWYPLQHAGLTWQKMQTILDHHQESTTASVRRRLQAAGDDEDEEEDDEKDGDDGEDEKETGTEEADEEDPKDGAEEEEEADPKDGGEEDDEEAGEKDAKSNADEEEEDTKDDSVAEPDDKDSEVADEDEEPKDGADMSEIEEDNETEKSKDAGEIEEDEDERDYEDRDDDDEKEDTDENDSDDKDNDGSNDGEESKEEEDEESPFQSRAGALKARAAGKRVEDTTTQTEIRKTLSQYDRMRGGRRGGFLRLRDPNVRKNRRFEKLQLKKREPSEGATDSMASFKPNTREFTERRQKILDAIEKRKGFKVRQKVERRWREIERSRGNIRLPYKKDALATRPRIIQRVPLLKRAVPQFPEEILMLDTSLSLVRGLRKGVYKSAGPLTFQKKRALKDWLELMSTTLPEEWSIHDVIDDLLKQVEFISKGEKNLHSVLDQHRILRKQHSPSCAKNGNGFSCGFWKLLHVMSVGLAEHRGGQTLIDSGLRSPDTRTFSPSEAASAVRDYMENFYLCDSCGKKFVANFDDCSKNRRCDRLAKNTFSATDDDWKEMGKWMWEVHNDLNVQIARESQQAEEKKKRGLFGRAKPAPSNVAALYPNMNACVKCYAADGTWDEEAVFLFLEFEYWPSTTVDPKVNRLLKFEEGFDKEGAGLFWLLIFVGIVMAFILNSSKNSLQQTMVVAKSASLKGLQAGAIAQPKRSD
mmetsp:Transcript_27240/g.75127  ORF Transcript_27240/g.75127 Transcript_27240/m.75127 type:complete len:827 (-) Transcript_27240:277-2757(-)